jgi:hypothetical protein
VRCVPKAVEERAYVLLIPIRVNKATVTMRLPVEDLPLKHIAFMTHFVRCPTYFAKTIALSLEELA